MAGDPKSTFVTCLVTKPFVWSDFYKSCRAALKILFTLFLIIKRCT